MSQTIDRTRSAFQGQQDQRDETAAVVATIDAQQAKYEGILPDSVPWKEFRNCFLVAVQRNWRLLEADRQSLYLALQECASRGLRPDGQEAALVIFGDDEEDEQGNVVASKANRKKKVVLLPMVWGLARLARNTGNVKDIRARCVYQGESFEQWEENGEEHYQYRRCTDPGFDDGPDKAIGAFAVIVWKDGSFSIDYMSRQQIERRRAVSRAKKGPWGPWWDEQACKTVLKHVFKRSDKARDMRLVHEALDADASLPTTIDGERPVEVAGQIEHQVQSEFTGDAGRQNVQQPSRRRAVPPQETQRAPSSEHRAPTEAPDAFRREVAQGATSAPQAGLTHGQQTTATAREVTTYSQLLNISPSDVFTAAQYPIQPAFEAWLVDADGVEQGAGEPMTDPVAFARAVAALCQTQPVAEILQVNEGAIADACDASEEARRIIEAITARPQQEPQQEPQQGAGDAGAPQGPQPVPAPRTPGGAIHVPNYERDCGAELARLATVAEVDAWVARNETGYRDNLQARTKIDRLVRAAKDRILAPAALAPQPGSEEQPARTRRPVEQPSASETQPVDRDAALVDGIEREVGRMTSRNAMSAYQVSMAVASPKERFARTGRTDLVQRIDAAFAGWRAPT